MLFLRIVSGSRSTLRPVSHSTALGHLLAQSGPELFDRDTMPAHLKTLAQLMRQTDMFELRAGADLRDSPALLPTLIQRQLE
jgi:hypothetical protein